MRQRSLRPFAGAFACAVLVIALRADATVTQVDGTILPVTGALQTFLNAPQPNGEGPGQIDAVLNAAEFPQIFKPNLTVPVLFRDMAEGAGFENSFGWYNVGDDVLTPAGRAANLHPIMGCGRPMVNGPGTPTTHSGNPAFYVQNAEPTSQVTVDFAQEQTALRYKGGFIGFYLITPENNPSANDNACGDFKNGTDGLSLFGFIYFTQKDLNNDGDFVHHLVYQSPTVANRFYFGFEDLFRGGDNDFEDMAMQIVGLTPPCVPQAEVCDGLDNDCDGAVDAADPDLTGVADACNCDDISLECDNGPRFGSCQPGITACVAGEITCHGTGTPSPEVCDGADNNCNNLVDDNPSGTGATCDGTDADACPEGAIVCQGGALVCSDATGPTVETCNNIDDDCDGPTDEGNPGAGGSCGTSLGVCEPGTFQCQGGTLVCDGEIVGGLEVCNGLDDDCDGVVDDAPTDVGQSCGATAEGECELGQTICVGGTLSCAGEVGPAPERCNLLDDNCNMATDDSPVDVGQPCGQSTGACEPGTYICVLGGLVCDGEIGPTAEDCDGIDDDCDGTIDDGVPGEGVPCGGTGPCSGGQTACINGAMECVGGTSGGTETCNDIDDDCDGMIDDGDLCNGGVCDNGVCAAPCAPDEIQCPTGLTCIDDFCVVDACFGMNCPPDAEGDLQTCRDGACVELCSQLQCPTDLVCRGSDGACVPNNCDYLPLCTTDQLCIDTACMTDPCLGVTCGGEQFCRGGACVASCEGVDCAATETCVDGTCVGTGCSGSCGDGVCNPTTGQCQDSACSGPPCAPNHVCDKLTGQCVLDPCLGVECPGEQACTNGQCGLSTGGALVTTGGGGGCDATGGNGSWLVAVIAALGLVLRRRRHLLARGGVAAAVLATGLVASGCKVNEYCLDCVQVGEDANTGDDGGGGDDGGTPTCDPSVVHPETCNNADDDCDGTTDEGFDKLNDEMNCGACGTQCNKPGAITSCQAGGCLITGCFPGFVDRDGDITGPYADSNGCEYMCFQSNGGVEACDGIDNNCNAQTDETFDLTMDPDNCGQCGRICEFFQATGHCAASTCSFDPAVDCQPGYLDVDGDQTNGCEYECTPTNGGVEACDVLDNNCDGNTDEGFDFDNDPANCSRCGLVCQFPHATASCTVQVCGFDPATDCDPGYVDVDGEQLDGCEYLCTPTNGGIEICDGVDNDCDGVADDNPVDAGASCAATTPPAGQCIADGTVSCASGTLVCSGASQPSAETCNNADEDCDGATDNGVSRPCYDGAPGTEGIGVCHGGTETCVAGGFGACANEVVPGAEQCNNLDDDCDSMIDDGPGGLPITQTCYSGTPGTEGVGTCQTGTETCAFGTFGTCAGEIDPVAEVCGDTLDSDCDSIDDTGEGCQVLEAELRLDAAGAAPGGGALGTAAGAQHSYDLMLATGGTGDRVYAVWSELVGGVTEVYFRRSTDGGTSWGTIANLTSAVAATAVKPLIVVSPGANDRVVVVYQTVTSGVRDIRVQVSTDSGATFGVASAALDASGDSFHQAAAVSGLNVVIVWERLNTTTLNRDVISRASIDGGATFGAEITVNVGSGATRFAGRPQVGITGATIPGVVWAWREQRGGSTRDMFAAASATIAGAPATDVKVDGDTTSARDSDFPVLKVSGDRAYLVWQDVSTATNGGSDAMFARSTDDGVTWGAERILDDPAAEVSSSFTPVITVDPRGAGDADDLVAVAWEDRRQGTQVFARVSVNGGLTFAAVRRVSSETGDPITGQTSAPQIATAGDGVLTVVYQNQQTGQNVHVYIASSIDSGATWTFTQARIDTGVGQAVTPQVTGSRVGGASAAVAGWTDFRAGTHINGDVYAAVSH